MTNNMEYFNTYLAACFIIANIILIKVNHKKIYKFFKLKQTFKQFMYIFFTNALTYLTLQIIFPLTWPLLLVMKIKEDLKEKRIAEEEEKSKFHIELKDLIQILDRKEIENNEIVHDPLEAVPPLPFGHLNKAWLAYCEQIEPKDDLWSFSATWTNHWGSKEQIEGYVAVRKGAIGPYFRTH